MPYVGAQGLACFDGDPSRDARYPAGSRVRQARGRRPGRRGSGRMSARFRKLLQETASRWRGFGAWTRPGRRDPLPASDVELHGAKGWRHRFFTKASSVDRYRLEPFRGHASRHQSILHSSRELHQLGLGRLRSAEARAGPSGYPWTSIKSSSGKRFAASTTWSMTRSPYAVGSAPPASNNTKAFWGTGGSSLTHRDSGCGVSASRKRRARSSRPKRRGQKVADPQYAAHKRAQSSLHART